MPLPQKKSSQPAVPPPSLHDNELLQDGQDAFDAQLQAMPKEKRRAFVDAAFELARQKWAAEDSARNG